MHIETKTYALKVAQELHLRTEKNNLLKHKTKQKFRSVFFYLTSDYLILEHACKLLEHNLDF